MQIGAQWAYREPPHTPGKACMPVEVLQFGPPKRQKVRIRLLVGEYPGLDLWVPMGRLLVPWESIEAYLDDERRYEVARLASRHSYNTTDYHAAWLVFGAYPRPDGILMGCGSVTAGVVEIADVEAVCGDLILNRDDLFTDPRAHLDRHGGYVGPWSMTLHLAQRVAKVYAAQVLDEVRKEEQSLEESVIRGKTLAWGKNDPPVFVPAERWVADLHQQQPVFARVRLWCGVEQSERFDEAEALRAEVERMRLLVLDAARRLKDAGHPQIASRLRKAVGAEFEPRSRARKKRD